MELEEIRGQIDAFAAARDWGQFHSVRNLILALVGEVGELAEIVQWIPDAAIGEAMNDEVMVARLAEEIADVFIYLIRLTTITQINLADAVRDKIAVNEARYPVERAFGSNAKYSNLK